MNINILRENLEKQLNTVGRIAGSRGMLPILSNVLLNADTDGLHLGSTNLEIGMSTVVSASVTKAVRLPSPPDCSGS